jgi:hypothetical protein
VAPEYFDQAKATVGQPNVISTFDHFCIEPPLYDRDEVIGRS